MLLKWGVIFRSRLWLSSIARRIAYKFYLFYEKKIAKKLPLYDLEVISVIKSLSKDANCIDIGVNEGQLFDYIVLHCNKGSIIGFEPIPALFQYLKNKYSTNNIRLFPYALSNIESTSPFYFFEKRTGVSGLANRHSLFPELAQKALPIEIKTLDSMIDLSRVDFIKIDVEGAELKVLEGAKELLLKTNPIIVFECQNNGLDFFDNTAEQIYDFLNELNFNISLVRYYLKGMPPLSKPYFLLLNQHRFEYQFIAWRTAIPGAQNQALTYNN